jgi:hypothetical protein
LLDVLYVRESTEQIILKALENEDGSESAEFSELRVSLYQDDAAKLFAKFNVEPMGKTKTYGSFEELGFIFACEDGQGCDLQMKVPSQSFRLPVRRVVPIDGAPGEALAKAFGDVNLTNSSGRVNLQCRTEQKSCVVTVDITK